MENLLHTLSHTPPKQILRKLLFRLRGRVVLLKPEQPSRGNVLISYTTTPFTLLSKNELSGHSNYWEVRDMAHAFTERGYTVEVIDKYNDTFMPKRKYRYFLDVESNMGRLAPHLGNQCTKIFFATGAYGEFQNEAEDSRIRALYQRRGTRVAPRRRVRDMNDIVSADIISGICGSFPASTYEQFGKPIRMIHPSTTHLYPFNEKKDWDLAKKNILWFGGAGAVHKGLDLVLEAFAKMPEYTLFVCGKFEGEKDFVVAYHTELYETPNIKSVGYVDPGGDTFKRIVDECGIVLSVSASEGCATSIVLAMHAGLIPIVNKETGINVGDFGFMLSDSTIDDIRRTVHALAHEQPAELERRARMTWEYAHNHHTRERFGKEFRAFLDTIHV